MPVILHLTEK